MADYYPLISRALDGLSDKSPETRRTVYGRARGALMAQLQSLDPPLPAAEITRERLALDEAIDRVEAEYALGEASFEPPPAPEPAAPVDSPHSRSSEVFAQATKASSARFPWWEAVDALAKATAVQAEPADSGTAASLRALR